LVRAPAAVPAPFVQPDRSNRIGATFRIFMAEKAS
jgi:hypothetical protein